MALIPRIVGVVLQGAPSEGDPRGARDASTRRAFNLTPAIALVLRARRVAGVAWVEARVFTDFGDFRDQFSEDQTRATPGTWFTPPDINV